MATTSDHCPPGVYLIDAGERGRVLGGEAFPAGYFVGVIDGDAADSRAGFFAEAARVLRFPDYFGHNWDAVYDCLTDLGWLPAAGYVLLIDGFGAFAAADPEQWAIGLKVLRDACAFWRPLRTPMYALLYDAQATEPGIPRLPERCFALPGRQAR